jgi:hypothetical protein
MMDWKDRTPTEHYSAQPAWQLDLLVLLDYPHGSGSTVHIQIEQHSPDSR